MWRTILEIIKQLLAAVTGFQQIANKKLTAELAIVKSEIKIDRLLDRDLRREAKILIGYQLQPPPELLQPGILYQGGKEILQLIKEDLGNVLTPKQSRIFHRTVRTDKIYAYYTIRVHPLTQHA